MNLYELKDKCTEAMRVLIRDHGFKEVSFKESNGDETLDAPYDLDHEFTRGRRQDDSGNENDYGYVNVLPGTMLLWVQTDYECNGWEPKLPIEVLADILFWENIDDDDIKLW